MIQTQNTIVNPNNQIQNEKPAKKKRVLTEEHKAKLRESSKKAREAKLTKLKQQKEKNEKLITYGDILKVINSHPIEESEDEESDIKYEAPVEKVVEEVPVKGKKAAKGGAQQTTTIVESKPTEPEVEKPRELTMKEKMLGLYMQASANRR